MSALPAALPLGLSHLPPPPPPTSRHRALYTHVLHVVFGYCTFRDLLSVIRVDRHWHAAIHADGMPNVPAVLSKMASCNVEEMLLSPLMRHVRTLGSSKRPVHLHPAQLNSLAHQKQLRTLCVYVVSGPGYE
jgi:hypothetical protein